MVDMNSIPDAPLKIILVIHFFLSTWGMQGDWSTNSYLFYNLLFFITLLWAIHQREAQEPIEIALFIGVSSILLDIIVLTVRFPSSLARTGERFSAGMAILNLLIRPVTSMVLYRIHADRTGTSGAFSNNFGGLFGASNAQNAPYEDIDRGVHQIVPGVHQSGMHNDRSSSPAMFAPSGMDRENKMPPPYHC
ncbi:type-1 angiotensin II receptor-associated protein [Anabrus simplex]|uniref:type-1 angiotensin II receptor-associated protein n=1 Tax=Anabrus simplex TaxID=316456 RepID=UPI0034DD0179